MPSGKSNWTLGTVLSLLLTSPFMSVAQGELYINELYFDPPGGLDAEAEYIELRGPAGMALTDHYLIFLESEGNEDAGGIDNIFDLGSFSLGSNGFMTLRQKGTPYTSVNPLANDYVNDGPNLPPFGASPGYGSGGASTIGHSDDGGEGKTENGAFSALLIRNDAGAIPLLTDDLDTDNDGQLDIATGKSGWTILDSIGESEPGESNAKFYAAINFQSAGSTGATVQAGGVIVDVPYEIEYLGRWGNSIGSTADDWHVSNLTNDNGSGFQNVADYRQSRADPHPLSDGDINTPAPQEGSPIETNKSVPYGTILTGTLGGPNYMTGDYNGNGVVDAGDYAVWRETVGQLGTELAHPAADHNHDFKVDEADLNIWLANYGSPIGGVATTTPTAPAPAAVSLPTATPEPAAFTLLAALGVLATSRRR